jgi:hypothetical protein
LQPLHSGTPHHPALRRPLLQVPPRLRGFVRGSINKQGYLRYGASLAEASTVLEL